MRENYVMLLGMIVKDPEITFDLDKYGNKTYRTGTVKVRTCREIVKSNKDGEETEINRWDHITLFTKNEDLIRRDLLDLMKGDLVRVKGTISTSEVIRRHVCQKCKYLNEYPGINMYVDPLSVHAVASGLSDEDITLILKDARFCSNIVHLAGFVTMEPQLHTSREPPYTEVLEFAIAGNRIRRILEDEDTKRTDFPWIKLYGSLAKKYKDELSTGCEIYLDGSIQKREPEILRKCERCGEEGFEQTEIMEVVPDTIMIIRYPEDTEETTLYQRRDK